MVICNKSYLIMELVQIFGINCTGVIFKILWLPEENEDNFKFSKITWVIYPKNFSNQTCDYCLITQNQQTYCIEVNIFWQRAITNQKGGNYKATGNYKIAPLTVQCRLQSIMWLQWKSIIVPWLNDEPHFKWILMHSHPMTLPDAVLYE